MSERFWPCGEAIWLRNTVFSDASGNFIVTLFAVSAATSSTLKPAGT